MFLPAPHAITYTIAETRARCHWYIHLSCPPRQARVKNGGAGDDRREGLPKINPGMAPTEHHSTLKFQHPTSKAHLGLSHHHLRSPSPARTPDPKGIIPLEVRRRWTSTILHVLRLKWTGRIVRVSCQRGPFAAHGPERPERLTAHLTKA